MNEPGGQPEGSGEIERADRRNRDGRSDSVPELPRDDDGAVPQRFQEIMATFGQWGPTPHPLADKMTSEHITSMLEIQREGVRGQFAGEADGRKKGLITVAMVLVFVLALVGILVYSGNAELTDQVVQYLVLIFGAGFGGWGWAKTRRD